jgi:hypothetical protein
VRDLVSDLLWRVRQQDRGVRIATRHLRAETLKGREKNRVVARCLLVFQLLCHIASHAEVRVLIDRTRDERGHICSLSVNVRESVAKAGNRLDWRVSELAYWVILVEAESTLYLIHCRVFLHLDGVRVQMLNVL